MLAKCSRFCLFEMGREKRKGKEVVVEKPVRKRTRAKREAERAEMVSHPVFKNKTEWITICMPGSSFIHIETS